MVLFLRDSSNHLLDSGWILIIQESRADTLKPIASLRTMVLRGGFLALSFVVVIMIGLWWLVATVLNAPNRLRASQLSSGHLTGTNSSTGSLGNSASGERPLPDSPEPNRSTAGRAP